MDDPVRQRGHPLGAALAGRDVQTLPVRLDVADLDGHGLGDAKPGAVGGDEGGTVAGLLADRSGSGPSKGSMLIGHHRETGVTSYVMAALSRRDTSTGLSVVFAWLYTLRNQIIHGGTTYSRQRGLYSYRRRPVPAERRGLVVATIAARLVR